MSRKRTTVLILVIIGISLTIVATGCYRYKQVVLEDWGGSVFPQTLGLQVWSGPTITVTSIPVASTAVVTVMRSGLCELCAG